MNTVYCIACYYFVNGVELRSWYNISAPNAAEALAVALREAPAVFIHGHRIEITILP